MDNDYWSIEGIYAQSQKIDCTFLTDVPNLGHLDGGDEPNIAAQTKMQLPFWLAGPLIINGHADPWVPQPFRLRVQKALNAEPKSVKLSQLVGTGGSWYNFGSQCSDLWSIISPDEPFSHELAEVLQKAFRSRMVELVDQAQNFGTGSGGDAAGNEFREGLESTERELFLLVQKSAQQAKQWAESTEKR
ncbi:GINS complex Psf3 component [Clavulina sp. PMI_390]|nr:GINS complex Psf3 component [Clavulina sp. PMI_390]